MAVVVPVLVVAVVMVAMSYYGARVGQLACGLTTRRLLAYVW